MSWRDDFGDLIQAAIAAMARATRDGERGGKSGTWVTETIEHQLRRIGAHITAYQCGDRNEDHLSHILCRAAIACALHDRETEGEIVVQSALEKHSGS
jgi:hypothetical protein